MKFPMAVIIKELLLIVIINKSVMSCLIFLSKSSLSAGKKFLLRTLLNRS